MITDIMLLDIGNTRLKTARLKGDDFIAGDELIHKGRLDIKTLKKIEFEGKPDRIVASCVVENKNENTLRKWAQKIIRSDIEFITSVQQQCGVINAYTDPTQLGSDRWMAMIAAHNQWQGNLCVVDAGSALTLDLIQADGRHLGGYIIPGMKMMQHCLLDSTEIPVSKSSIVLANKVQQGSNTINCISNGALQAVCGLVERTIMQFEQETQQSIQCIVTGGDGQRLADNLNFSCVIEPNLVLRGIGHYVRSKDSL